MTIKYPKRGKSGEAKLAILEEFILNPDKKMMAREIFRMLKERFKIKQRRGVFTHLNHLVKSKLLAYDPSENLYYLPENYKTKEYWLSLIKALDIRNDKLWERVKKLSMFVSEDAANVCNQMYWDKLGEKVFKWLEKEPKNKLETEEFRTWLSVYFYNFAGYFATNSNLNLLNQLLSNLKKSKRPNGAKERLGKLITNLQEYRSEIQKHLLSAEEKLIEMAKQSKIPKGYVFAFYVLKELMQEYLKYVKPEEKETTKNKIKDLIQPY